MSPDRFLTPVPPAAKRIWLATAICLVCVAVATYKYWYVEWQLASLSEAAANLRLPQPTRRELSKAEVERNQEWNKLALERRFNWYPIFKALEHASSEEVELLAFEPDKTNGQLVLRGEARNLEALVAYLAALSRQDVIGRAYLTRQKSSSRQSLKTTAFEIRATLTQ